MTAEVLPFISARARRDPDPHTCGPTKCERCGHEEAAAVIPVGVKWVECAVCRCMSARRAGPVLPADGTLRQACPCCKAQTFVVMPDNLMCSDCGQVVAAYWGKAS